MPTEAEHSLKGPDALEWWIRRHLPEWIGARPFEITKSWMDDPGMHVVEVKLADDEPRTFVMAGTYEDVDMNTAGNPARRLAERIAKRLAAESYHAR